jgi:hypothetical protein
LTLRSWIQTEDSKRRTLQRNDVASAIGKTDTFDFLIDIVPREDSKFKRDVNLFDFFYIFVYFVFLFFKLPVDNNDPYYYSGYGEMVKNLN